MNPEMFQAAVADTLGFELSDRQLQQFEKYAELLQEWNEKINLTAIVDTEEIYLKHFYDCLTLAEFADFTATDVTLCDVGSGAGFPSIPLKILFPELKITIIDSLQKRIRFLDLLVEELELSGVKTCHGRAEDFGDRREFREQYDYVTARAVARMSVLSEYCLPFAKVGGQFLAMKGDKGKDELADARRAVKTLGGRTRDVHIFELPEEAGERSVLVIDKVKRTPKKYPRQAGAPNKQPL